jgi:hypothetical protein
MHGLAAAVYFEMGILLLAQRDLLIAVSFFFLRLVFIAVTSVIIQCRQSSRHYLGK